MFSQLAMPFGNYVLTGVIATFGDSAVAAWAVVSRLTIVAFGGLFALSGSSAIFFLARILAPAYIVEYPPPIAMGYFSVPIVMY